MEHQTTSLAVCANELNIMNLNLKIENLITVGFNKLLTYISLHK